MAEDRATRAIGGQWGYLFPWVPVFFGTGIGLYFALPVEPGPAEWSVAAALALICLLGVLRTRGETAAIPRAGLILLAGLAVAGLRTADVAAPKLDFRYYGPIEGRIVTVDRSASDAVRLTLDQVRLDRVAPDRTPARVRVSLHGMAGDFISPAPGQVVMLTGHLSPPGGPVEPGGFDFARQAWFLQLGAVGYTRTPVLLWQESPGGLALVVARARHAIGNRVREVLPGRTGAFAAAVTTGDRSAMDSATLESLRLSNLAHLLAISGLHMGMLTGFVFLILRLVLALWPHASLRWPTKKVAACGALAAGACYLTLSGGNVATERAFIMVGVMLGAVLLDRRAVSLRAVAVAAMIVLSLRPEALLGPGFQMSFAATTALVAVFEALRADPVIRARTRVLRFLGALVLTSLVAGLATAPFAAVHFNRVPHFGLLANVASVPVMGLLVMPAAVLAAVLAPFGAEALGLKLMAPGIDWILAVADWTAALPGAVSHVTTPPTWVLATLTAGALFLALWRGPSRLLGVPVTAIAFCGWALAERPPVLVSESGGLLGAMTSQGRALSRQRGEGFAAENWLENDGDAAGRDEAFARPGLNGRARSRIVSLGDARILHATGKVAAAEAVARCAEARIVIVNVRLDAPPGCDLFDSRRLRRLGSLAIWPSENGLKIIGARGRAARPWSRQ